jgi:hypothetical protein
LSNHLGNVLVTVTDLKVGIDNGGNWTAEYYEATVVSAVDYYPFECYGRKKIQSRNIPLRLQW